jgi:16S rRNA U516 pseudouridylate synthase RsuA-like enzyme
MLAAAGFPVLRLIRTSIEDLKLGGLKAGEVREMEREEIFIKLKLTNKL